MVCYLVCAEFSIHAGSLDKLVLVVISQSNSFHVTQTNTKLEKWKNELQSLTKVRAIHLVSTVGRKRVVLSCHHQEEPLVIVSHELELEGTAWTIVPLIRR